MSNPASSSSSVPSSSEVTASSSLAVDKTEAVPDTSTPVTSSDATAATTSNGIEAQYPRFRDEVAKYTKPEGVSLGYGTAGFRADASILASTFHRMGMLAVLRARQTSKIIGIMVTASHNPAADNGIKMVDTDGGMLASSWEKHATAVANAVDDTALALAVDTIISEENIDMERTGNIFIAKDTRQSSEYLSELAREGALLLGGNVLDFSLQTTPQLHHYVRMWNCEKYNRGDWASEAGYYHMLVDGFKNLTTGLDPNSLSSRGTLVVDCAHGVGAQQLTKLAAELQDNLLAIEVRNIPADGELNLNSGAEHCQKGKTFPSGFSPEVDRMKRCASVDGDADRVVYHYFDNDGVWHLVDGDKIASLFALFFKENSKILEEAKVSFGVVQTAYANGASTSYLQKTLGITPAIAKTGVKYCHHVAVESFDIGLYFEANGHGTVLFSDSAVEKLQKLEATLTDEGKKASVSRVLSAQQVINQAVGDALSDILLVEAILASKNWGIAEWDGIYSDVPSRQTKLPVKDRTIIQCNESETKVISPVALQEEIDNLVSQAGESGRAFVRPSGTENVVRVYAEAGTESEADKLALAVANAVHSLAGGVGEAPSSFVA